jgi:hypothetical protein
MFEINFFSLNTLLSFFLSFLFLFHWTCETAFGFEFTQVAKEDRNYGVERTLMTPCILLRFLNDHTSEPWFKTYINYVP